MFWGGGGNYFFTGAILTYLGSLEIVTRSVVKHYCICVYPHDFKAATDLYSKCQCTGVAGRRGDGGGGGGEGRGGGRGGGGITINFWPYSFSRAQWPSDKVPRFYLALGLDLKAK